ncbi:MAG: polysaccharide biosynthesis protein, partial [Planctomycetota bacterium]
LARVCAAFEPSELIVMDRAENALFEIDRQLRERYPHVTVRAALHDVADAEGTREIISQTKPHVVFHAAAHKHVPLMEEHPWHAVTNNVFGTKAIADAAAEFGVERFVLISSDKAVNPSSVMGATKRLAELYTQSLHSQLRDERLITPSDREPTSFSMVRFGNVLGSACSVLPIWSAQLADGGPITVTDERMTRYFMTIAEAASLVVQAAAIAPIGIDADAAGVFVLDMGEPVNIMQLAERFVRAHGLEPIRDRDGRELPIGCAEIVSTGARPGEKLHEELAYAAENLKPTSHAGIFGWRFATNEAVHASDAMIESLTSLGPRAERTQVLAELRRWIPTLPESRTTTENPDAATPVRLAG